MNAQLRFETASIVLTDQRIGTRAEAGAPWQTWSLTPDLTLQHHDHAGVGALELVSAQGRLAVWYFTLEHQVQVVRLIEQFERHQAALHTGETPAEDDKAQCPSCKAPLPPESDECPVCHRELQTPPSTWVLSLIHI